MASSLPIRSNHPPAESMIPSNEVVRSEVGAQATVQTGPTHHVESVVTNEAMTSKPLQTTEANIDVNVGVETNEILEGGMVVTDPNDLPEGKKKKKKSRKSASKRGLNKPTGMEEFYADTPMTPAEYEEQQELYHSDISFLDRILTAIQRFEQTRKLTPERRDIFYKWLHYGSIIVSQNIGTGKQNTKDMDKDEVVEAMSRVAISDQLREGLEITNPDEAKYVVDFMGCMKGFLSRRARLIYAFDRKEDIDTVTATLERFMDYLLQHDVCPEYGEDILKTRNFCRVAGRELWLCTEAQKWLPGDFNIACSTLFGGSYGQHYDGQTFWGDLEQEKGNVFVGQTEEEASQIFGYALAGTARQEVYERYIQLTQSDEEKEDEDEEQGLKIVTTITGQGFEITELVDPTTDCKVMYKTNSQIYRPVGKVLAKAWNNPLDLPEDLTTEERNCTKSVQTDSEVYEFFVEEIVMRNLYVGQSVIATIRKLNCGVWFFDTLTEVHPAFDTFLVNELMEDYKEPRWLEGSYAPGAPGWYAQDQDADIRDEKSTGDYIGGAGSNSDKQQDDTHAAIFGNDIENGQVDRTEQN